MNRPLTLLAVLAVGWLAACQAAGQPVPDPGARQAPGQLIVTLRPGAQRDALTELDGRDGVLQALPLIPASDKPFGERGAWENVLRKRSSIS